jgi:hypothetical protein
MEYRIDYNLFIFGRFHVKSESSRVLRNSRKVFVTSSKN